MKMSRPWIQAAVDVEEMEKALEITRMASEAGAEWIEAGTPLLFRYGYDAVSKIKEAAGDAKVVADYKFPYPHFVVPRAAAAGADFLTVEDCYSDEMVSMAVSLGEKYNIGIIMTLLSNHPADIPERALRLQELGAKYIFIRRKVSYKGVTYSCMRDLSKIVNVKIGVTDDNLESVLEAVDEGADWIIFGTALKDANPEVCRHWIDSIHGRR